MDLSLADTQTWSPEAEIGFDVLRILGEIKKELPFLLSAYPKHSSDDIAKRWEKFVVYCTKISEPVIKYEPTILKVFHEKLTDQILELDQYNVEIQEHDEGTLNMLEYELKEYAEIVISALLRQMSDEEKELFDNNRWQA